MSSEKKLIESIRCPICNKRGSIEVSEKSTKNVAGGLLVVNVSRNVVCEHTFLAYIDKNFNVRDYFVADFHVILPEVTLDEGLEELLFPNIDVADIDLIKLNLTANLLTYILTSIFFGRKVVIINDQYYLCDHVVNFFSYICQNSFDINISFVSEDDYKKNKKQHKDCMIFQGSEIIRNDNKLINPKKLWIEKHIINRFITENDSGHSYINFRNEVQKVYRFSKEISEFVRQNEDNHNAILVKKYLEEKYHTKIDQLYIKFLIEIVDKNFIIKIPSMVESLFRSF